jgi:hypothetical protein
MGNQLFCYAAARRLALANGAELVIDGVSGFARDRAYERQYQLGNFCVAQRMATPAERLEPFSRVRRHLKRSINRRRSFAERSYIEEERLDFDARVLAFIPRGTVYIEGYWQSEMYFKDVERVIRKDLSIVPPTDERNRMMAERMRGCRAIAVHLRFFDRGKEADNNWLPEGYYTRAISIMQERIPEAHFFLFSDQPEMARQRVPLPEWRMTLVGHNKGEKSAYADLWLMTLCQHFIIANSTFSWWGAWLGESPGKTVIAPGFGRRDGKVAWGFKGLLPAEWTKL